MCALFGRADVYPLIKRVGYRPSDKFSTMIGVGGSQAFLDYCFTAKIKIEIGDVLHGAASQGHLALFNHIIGKLGYKELGPSPQHKQSLMDTGLISNRYFRTKPKQKQEPKPEPEPKRLKKKNTIKK